MMMDDDGWLFSFIGNRFLGAWRFGWFLHVFAVI